MATLWDNFKGLDSIGLNLIHTQLLHEGLSQVNWVSYMRIDIRSRRCIRISGRLAGAGELGCMIWVRRILRVLRLRLAACLAGVGKDVAI